ncbi:MAG: hypothetical protein ABW360_18365, partial [Phenylobacterium sp.]
RKWLAGQGQTPDAEFDGAEIGTWPARIDTSLSLTVAEDILKRRPLDRAHIALIPAANGWKAIAHLKWGGWNDNPHAEYHVAARRSSEGCGGLRVGSARPTAHHPPTPRTDSMFEIPERR